MPKLTLEEIGRLAGVSRSTVSRVVNGHDTVHPELRERVEKVVRDTGYHPNLAARSLASNRSGIIGLVIPSRVQFLFSDPYFPRLIQGITGACNNYDYTVSLFLFHSKDEEEKIYPRVLQPGYVDGVIVTATEMGDPLVQQLAAEETPYVVVGRPDNASEASFVDADNVAGAYTAVVHLLASGRERIATITGPLNTTAAIDRKEGYTQALAVRGHVVDEALVVEGDFTEAGGYRAMKQLLPLQPDALFAASDAMALGAMHAINEAGLTVPQDIALISFDDLMPPSLSTPQLTTVRQPVRQVGARSVEVLLDLLQNGMTPPRRVVLPTELVIRHSCGAAT